MKLFSWTKTETKITPPRRFDHAEFDIEGMHVFSVERDDGQTIIGYFAGAKVRQWFLPCSPEKHLDLVARLQAKIARRERSYSECKTPVKTP